MLLSPAANQTYQIQQNLKVKDLFIPFIRAIITGGIKTMRLINFNLFFTDFFSLIFKFSCMFLILGISFKI